jgi:hypothetical protein
MDESMLCARMCIHQIEILRKKKKKKKQPVEKGAGRELFLWGGWQEPQVSKIWQRLWKSGSN